MAEPVLTLFEQLFLKKKSASDLSQVPANGATARFYYQGATLAEDVDLWVEPPEATITVYDRGDIQVGDVIRPSNNAGAEMRVTGTPGRDTIEVENLSGFDFSLAKNFDRLLRVRRWSDGTSLRPVVYQDPHGLVSLGSDVVLPDGRLRAYVAQARFDYMISGGGLTSRLYRDSIGGAQPNPSWVAVLDHQLDIQAAVNALPSCGGEVFLQAATYVLTATLVLNKPNVCLRGQGANTIISGPQNPSFDLVRVEKSFCRLSDLKIDGNATSATAEKSCLTVAGAEADNIFLKNLVLTKASGHGLNVLDAGQVFGFNCEGTGNHGDGFHLQAAGRPLIVRLVACSASENGTLIGVFASGAGTLADGVALMGCLLDSGIEAYDLNGMQVIGCRFKWTGGPAMASRLLGATSVRALIVEGCWFDGQAGAPVPALRAAVLTGCPGAGFVNNVGERFSAALASFVSCVGAVEMGNRELDVATPRIEAVSSTLFGLSKGVVEPFRYDATPAGAESWPTGTMFWDPFGLRVVVGGVLKKVELESL